MKAGRAAMPFLRTTPGRLASWGAALVAGFAGMFLVAQLAIGHLEEPIRVVGSETEPSVVAAEELHAALSGIYTNALGGSLAGDGSAGKTWGFFEEGRREAVRRIVEASRGITYGESEARPIRAVVENLTYYFELVGQARAWSDTRPALAATKVRWAARVMRDDVLPHVDELRAANTGPLEESMRKYSGDSAMVAASVAAAGILLLGALAASQLSLARRSRTVVDPLVAAATLVTATTVCWFTVMLFHERDSITVARDDAFASVESLYRARSATWGMHAAASLWLLDASDNRKTWLADFDAGLVSLAGFDIRDDARADAVIAAAGAALELERAGDPAGAAAATPRFPGFLGKELANVTFGYAERAPATEALVRLRDYVSVNGRVRALEPGYRPRAVEIELGDGEGQASSAFRALDASLRAAIAVNQGVFEKTVARASSDLSTMGRVMSAGLLASAVMACLGLWRRYSEFR